MPDDLDTGGEMVPWQEPPRPPQMPIPIDVSKSESVWTNIPDSPETLPLLISVSGPAGRLGKDIKGVPFECQWVHVSWVAREDPETSEIHQDRRILFFAPDGASVAASGPAVCDALQAIVKAIGPGPWIPPLVLSIVGVKGSRGHDYNVLRLVKYVPSKSKKG